MIQMFSNFSYFSTNHDFVYLCLPLFGFVQITHQCTNYVLVQSLSTCDLYQSSVPVAMKFYFASQYSPLGLFFAHRVLMKLSTQQNLARTTQSLCRDKKWNKHKSVHKLRSCMVFHNSFRIS